MGHFFRSQDMSLLQFILPSDACYESVGELGELGTIQFKDLNSSVNAFQRNFVKELRVCEDMERRLRVFASQLKESGICDPEEDLIQIDSHEKFTLPMQHEVDELSDQLMKLEMDVLEMKDNQEMLQRNYLELAQLRHLLVETRSFFALAESATFENDETSALLDMEGGSGNRSGRLGFSTGVVNRDKFATFERVLWRGCRGNVFMRSAEIPETFLDPITNEMVTKIAFTIHYQGTVLEKKVKRICDGFGCTLYSCPDTLSQREELAARVQSSIDDLKMVLSRTDDYRAGVHNRIASQYEEWAVKVRKVKMTYFTMNMFNFDVTNSALIAEGWCPTRDLDLVIERLNNVTSRLDSGVSTIVREIKSRDQPPTYHMTNKLTYGYQNLIDSYGVASYKEINPALFSCISFPFLFAVMFGDFGHGFLMAAFSFYMIYHEKTMARQNLGEMVMTIFYGRYIIFMMGLFSIYTGLIYNDIFSKSVWIFPTGWVLPGTNVTHTATLEYGGDPYPFGIDPVWSLASNKLSFMNAFKMKISVLIGVTHMLFGVILSALNHLHFKNYLKFFGEFIPQLIFITSIFGYLCVLIVAKWLTTFPDFSPPSILIILINMFLSPGTVEVKTNTYFYEHQATVQVVLVLMAVACIPFMLLTVPIGKYVKYRMSRRQGYQSISSDGGHGEGEEFKLEEIIVHSSIHTIEYCLGCVSNTASYLRLWALSLAHAQLSEVLWNMVMKVGLTGNFVVLYLAFGFWAILSIAVLLCMEGMSAFLHALRLHWVEFNNKFYVAEGYPFVPFAYKKIFEAD